MKPCAAKGRGKDLAGVDRDTKEAAAAVHTLDFAAYRAELADNTRLPGQKRTCQNFTHVQNPTPSRGDQGYGQWIGLKIVCSCLLHLGWCDLRFACATDLCHLLRHMSHLLQYLRVHPMGWGLPSTHAYDKSC